MKKRAQPEITELRVKVFARLQLAASVPPARCFTQRSAPTHVAFGHSATGGPSRRNYRRGPAAAMILPGAMNSARSRHAFKPAVWRTGGIVASSARHCRWIGPALVEERLHQLKTADRGSVGAQARHDAIDGTRSGGAQAVFIHSGSHKRHRPTSSAVTATAGRGVSARPETDPGPWAAQPRSSAGW